MFGLNQDQLAFFHKVFDLFSNNSTFMNADQLGLVMSSLGSDLSRIELEDLVTEIDLNGDGTIDF
jgi:Ca2+-binding EF-hand superfamily protein